MTPRPFVSLIIPSHNRSRLLEKNLEALNLQSCPADGFEVLVIADSCQDDTPAMLQSFSSRANYSLQFFSLSAGSAAASRNLGASNARGDVLLFLDDDVLAHPDLVRAHVTAQRDERVAIGYSKPVYQTPLSWWHYGARRWWEDTFSEMRRPGHRFTFRDFLTGNVSLPAALFRRVGGFDTAFSDAGYEDYELGVRLLEAGARFCFVPEAVGYHHDETNLGRSLLRTRREGIGIVRIGKRHPEMIGTALKFPETNSWVTKRLRALAFDHSGLGDRIARLLVRQAEFFERTRLRAPWQHTVAWLRCYNFWRGVAIAAGSEREFYDWLEGIAPPPAVAGAAPVLELTSLQTEEVLQPIPDRAARDGLRVSMEGVEVLALAPQPGAEPLCVRHVRDSLLALAEQRYVPALAFHLAKQSWENRPRQPS